MSFLVCIVIAEKVSDHHDVVYLVDESSDEFYDDLMDGFLSLSCLKVSLTLTYWIHFYFCHYKTF